MCAAWSVILKGAVIAEASELTARQTTFAQVILLAESMTDSASCQVGRRLCRGQKTP